MMCYDDTIHTERRYIMYMLISFMNMMMIMMMILCMHLFILVSYIHESSNTIRRWFSSNKKHAACWLCYAFFTVLQYSNNNHHTHSYHHYDRHDDHTYQHTWCPNIKKIYIKQSISKEVCKIPVFSSPFYWLIHTRMLLRIIGHA